MKKIFLIFILTCFAVFSYSGTVIVTNTNDSGTGSLRASVALANSGDTIRFSPVLILRKELRPHQGKAHIGMLLSLLPSFFVGYVRQKHAL